MLSATIGVSAYTVVAADSLEEAIAIAKNREPVNGAYCSKEEIFESWIVDDIDGLPTDIHGE